MVSVLGNLLEHHEFERGTCGQRWARRERGHRTKRAYHIVASLISPPCRTLYFY